jgi:hypothetical protein
VALEEIRRDPALAKLAFEARSAVPGLWSEPDPVAPWDWRRMRLFQSIFCFVLLAIFPNVSAAIDAEWVTAVGIASLENVTKTEARRMAINDARRNAIEKVVGAEILSETMVINNQVSGDVICALPYGKVLDQKIINESVISVASEDKGTAPLLTYKVEMNALVSKEQGQADPYFRVAAKINRKVFKNGDQIELRITPTRDAYISVFNILEDQTALILIPNRFRKDNFVKAHQTLIFPSKADKMKGIVLEACTGEGQVKTDEMFHIIAMKEPFEFDSAKFTEGIFGLYDGNSGLVNDLVKETVRIPLSHRAETFIHYRIEK